MPVSAKLSGLLQERLGEDTARVLVEWLNEVEKGRLDARLEHRLDMLELRLLAAIERLEPKTISR